MLREVTVKIGLKQKDNEDRITMEVLLDSGVTGLGMSSEFVRKNKFKKRVESSILDTRRANGNILWIDKLTSNFSDDNE